MKKDRRTVNLRTGPDRFVRVAKALIMTVGAVMFVAIMILFVFAFNSKGLTQVVFSIAAAASILCFLILYGYYELQISMGTVIGLEVTDKVVHLITKRKTFTYDATRGCVKVKEKRTRYICTFESQDSRDKFSFYKRAPFSRYSDSQFSEADVRRFYPAFGEETDF